MLTLAVALATGVSAMDSRACVAVLIASLAVCACHYHRTQPLPGPRSGTLELGVHPLPAHHREPASEISYFQGTLEEAFSRPAAESHADCRQRYNPPRLGL